MATGEGGGGGSSSVSVAWLYFRSYALSSVIRREEEQPFRHRRGKAYVAAI